MVVGLGLAAGGLLRSAPIGSVSIRNYLAGWCLPWSAVIGSHRLAGLVFKNVALTVVLGTAVILMVHLNDAQPPSKGILTVCVFSCWTVLFVGWVYFLNGYLRSRGGTGRPSTNGEYALALGIPCALAISIIFWWNKSHIAALIVAGLPIALLLLPVGLLLLAVILSKLAGKPIRWN